MSKIASAIFKTFFLSLCIVANTHFAFAQTASILPQGYTQYLDSNGKPLSAGKVYNYIPNTTTPKTTWQDAGETIPNANPVVLDAGGRAKILGDGNYRQKVYDRNNVLIWDANTSSTGSGSSSSTATGDGDLVGTIKPWAGMTAPNQYAFTYGQEVSRTTYSALFTAITSSQPVFCSSGSPTLSGLSDTTNFWIGMAVEASCVLTGASTVVSKTSSSVTLAANANVSTNTTATFFPWGRGNGSTTFNLPDLRGVIPAGNNNMGGVASPNLTTTYFGATNPNSSGALGGSQSKTLTAANVPSLVSQNFATVAGTAISTTSRFVSSDGSANSVQDAGTAFGFTQVPTFGAVSSTVSITRNSIGVSSDSGGIAVSALIANGGSGYTNGSQTITVAGGTCTTQPQFTVTVAGNAFTGTPVLLTAGNCTVAPQNPVTTTGGGGTGGTLNVSYSAIPFSAIPPTRTTNFIIKITPDTNSATASGVTSLGGMTGDIACGSGLLCTGNTISSVAITQSSQTFANLATATAATISGSVSAVITLGYTTAGDNGGATYTQVGAGPATAYRFQSADGKWWQLSNRNITPEQFACVGNGVANDTSCFNAIGSYLTLNAANPPTLNHRTGAQYKIWPAGSPPSTLMTLTALNNFTWNFNGSCLVTDQVFAAGYGIALIANSSGIFVNDPCYTNTGWTGPLSPLLGAVFFAIQESSAPWTNNVIINNLTMDGGLGAIRVLGNITTAAASTGGDANNIQLHNAYIANVMYPMLFQGSGDNFIATNVRINNAGRAYFPWNVSNHKVDITHEGSSTAGGLQQLELTTYAYPNMSISRRQLSNINISYRMTAPGAGYIGGQIGAEAFIQTVPRATISAAASCGATCTRLTVNSTANMLDGQQWYCSGATGTTAINGYQTIDVQSATTVDVPVTFVATSPGGYCTVPATHKNISIRYDVLNDGVSGNPLLSTSKTDEASAVDTFARGYEMSNIEISGRLINYRNVSVPVFDLFSPSLGTWTGESVNNYAIRNFVLSGSSASAAISINGPNSASSINLENIVSSGITWTLGGTTSAFNVMNVSATGITDRNTVVPSTAPANQFANGISAAGAIAYAQVDFSNLSGSIATTQIPTTGVPARIGAVARVVRQSFCASGCSTTIASGGSGTYTPTTGLLYAVVEIVGSGGGGGGAVGVLNQHFVGGGGGGGGYTRSVLSAATIGASKTIIIGALGTGGAAGANNGTAGAAVCLTTTSCVSGQIVVANGGSGGQFSQTGVQGGRGGAGGTIGTGDLVTPGFNGQGGLYYPSGGSFGWQLGAGGNSPWGSGALSSVDIAGSGSNGASGSGYGAGGSGGSTQAVATNRAGGDGTAGAVFITEYVNQ